MSKSPEELYKEREQRLNDAIALKVPDRVPIAPLIGGLFVARYGGMTVEEAMTNFDKVSEIAKKMYLEYQWDTHMRIGGIFPKPMFDTLGVKLWKWPGEIGGLPTDVAYQFAEEERMTAEEYPEFLENPTEFMIKKWLPRVAKAFEPIANLPSILQGVCGYNLLLNLSFTWASPDLAQMFESIVKAGQRAMDWLNAQIKLTMELTALGFPGLWQDMTQAPFDVISEFLRGFRGAMLDMYRNPEELKKACEILVPEMIKYGQATFAMTGNPRVFIPLHRGAGGFMSNTQFEEFYWPTLKEVILALVDNGQIPYVFYEGDYEPRLEYLKELPKGKTIAHLDNIDIFKAKEVIGDTMCIKGNVPPSLLCAGTPAKVEEYCKKLIEIVGEGGGFIMDGAVSGIPDEAKPENVKAMTEATFKYGIYRK
ncbi:MAG: uroporphyrinogen decarboxylase family protein [Candidatus Lokiarchaeia archaeon]